MSQVTDEAMDSSAVLDEKSEDQQEASREDESSPSNSRPKISAAGEILEGKRAKKTVERLDFQAPKQKEKLKLGDGSGEKLGDIPRIGYQIVKMKQADLKPLHAILFDRPGKMATLKKTLRQFNGFPFDADSEQFAKKREKLLRNFTNTKLKVVCSVLDLEKKGTHADLVDRIMTFLVVPKSSGKRLSVKRKRKSKKRLSGDDADGKTKKRTRPRPRSSSSSPKKSKMGSKSKAIIMDSSSDEEDEKAGASAEAEGSDAEDKPSEKEDETSDKSERSAEEEEEDEDDESPKSKSGKEKSASKRSAPVKRQRTPAKKSAAPRKRSKKEPSDESEPDDEPQKKKAAPSKPAAKTKRADSSSNSKANANTAEDSSDEDEPLIKLVKKAPTDEQLKETVRSLLTEANLEEMTMKQICQRVFDTYPDHDLTDKKDHIKQTVKSLIT